MERLHVFVPENDTALASGPRNAGFTAPPAAWALHLSGEALPLWYGAPGDRFLSYGINDEWLRRINADFHTGIDVADAVEASALQPSPWGWSAYTRRIFEDFDVEASLLPTDEQLLRMRELSHRRLAIRTLQSLRRQLPDCPLAGRAIEVTDPDHLLALCEEAGGGILKAPWSSSGRGVLDTSRLSPQKILEQGKGIIRRQGSVIWEEHLERVMDLAMLFRSSGGIVEFVGWSVFTTADTGEYLGNVVAPDEKLLKRISALVSPEVLTAVRDALCQILSDEVAADYEGLLGIDMMVCRLSDGTPALAPCIEVNLRTTMGHVAHGFACRFLAPDAEGLLTVRHTSDMRPSCGEYVAVDGRLTSGHVLLSPPQGFTIAVEIMQSI